jgi:hypothetical protein
MVNEQGFEMGCPSPLQVKFELYGQHIRGMTVGGHCYFIGEGWITLAE